MFKRSNVQMFKRWVVFTLLTLLVATGTVVSSDEPKAIGLTAARFTLEDQYQQRWAWKDHWQGKPTVVVVSDWKGSDYLESWTLPLTARFKDRVQFVAIADLSLTQEAPSFMQASLQGTLRERFREAYKNSILMDWKGRVCSYYRVRNGLPNVLYIDATGVVRLHTWGSGKEDHVNAFAEALENQL